MDPAVIAAVISTAGFVFLGVMQHRSGRKLDQVHVLVNSRLSSALDEGEAARATIEKMGGPVAPPLRTRRPDEQPPPPTP